MIIKLNSKLILRQQNTVIKQSMSELISMLHVKINVEINQIRQNKNGKHFPKFGCTFRCSHLNVTEELNKRQDVRVTTHVNTQYSCFRASILSTCLITKS